jgi:hypothetical protein
MSLIKVTGTFLRIYSTRNKVISSIIVFVLLGCLTFLDDISSSGDALQMTHCVLCNALTQNLKNKQRLAGTLRWLDNERIDLR